VAAAAAAAEIMSKMGVRSNTTHLGGALHVIYTQTQSSVCCFNDRE
jgi:hypothetical protein